MPPLFSSRSKESMSTNKEKQKVLKEISEKLSKARELLDECERLADEHQVAFHFELHGSLEYRPHKPKAPEGEFEESNEDGYYDNLEGWVSSSDRC